MPIVSTEDGNVNEERYSAPANALAPHSFRRLFGAKVIDVIFEPVNGPPSP